MKGFWGQPDRTDKGFYRRPAFEHFEDRFYRTGDLVQVDSDGNYRYLGRKDRQIKTRGYRVELDEIEVALLSDDSVQEAAVYPVPDGLGSNLIQASVILKNDADRTVDELISHVAEKLPPYAVPVAIEVLQDFPRTSTGKIDRRKIRELALSNQLKSHD
jgi:acyl-coenzyme A synthetase/AMP-(fatty) acid ligase